MTDILIRNIDDVLDKALKMRAIENGRTREAEIKVILESAVSSAPQKRTLAEVLINIPKLDTDVDELFKRPTSSARKMD